MAKYDVYASASNDGYFLDLQTDFLDSLNSRIVAPLLPIEQTSQKPILRLNPSFIINSEKVILLTHLLSAIPETQLQGKPIASLADEFDKISSALDMLFHGF